ncbi:TrbG/VirB9 family P-type conjugative transfer protein [Arcobacter sp. F2176]|uniref:TrbG/VirB9 family P-type conjugative transfer protein n=1 Tax=Arcobacter sp. F2176 TaxID=2044511 RepID=UPI00100A9A43|nr:TrbG/VirB9 family P-type conjugative transfer protein [Arcobacter sp. F2176]RXJ82173.1 hypothetical protein CRU95_04610 [Arcobacter sp. F2176]
MKKIFFILIALSCYLFSFQDITTDTINTSDEAITKAQKDLLNGKDTVIDLNSIQKAFFVDKSEGKTVSVYKYNQNSTIKIRTRIFMKSTVILPDGEIPISAIFGEDTSFTIELLKDKETKYKLDNVFTVKPNFLGADTNLTVLGSSGRAYTFYLYSIGVDDKRKPNLLNYVTLDGALPKNNSIDNLDEKDKEIAALSEEIEDLKNKLSIQKEDKSIDLTKFNISGTQFDYKLKKAFSLEAVFNDKKNTYFKFKDGFSVPKIYYKDELNNNISIPYTIEKNILKVKKLSKDWVLELDGKYSNIEKIGKFEFKEILKTLIVDMTKTDFSFFFTKGDKSLKPEVVFHDKEFTYFKFDISNGFKKFPPVFEVLDGHDSPVFDYEIVGEFIVTKSVNDAFTLRLGEKHFCIRYKNEN